MNEPPKVDPALRATLRVALMVSLLGSCGAVNGLSQVASPQAQADAGPLDTSGDAASRQAAEAANEVLLDITRQDSLRRVFGGMNIVVSMLLMVAGVVLVMRRPAAIWWITQATIANTLFIVVQTIAILRHIHELTPRLAPALDAYLRAASTEPVPEDASMGMVATYIMMGIPVLWSLVRVAIHVGVAWRARRPDIRGVLIESSPGEPGG